MKKVVIVNGSPRKNGNTASLCDAFQDGVQSVAESAEVLRFDLNDYSFKGCQSCFSCKLKGRSGYGRCSLNDDLSQIIEAISDADCLVVASPIYLMDVSASTKAFLERLCFSLATYESGYRSLASGKTDVVTIYTMNTTADYSPVHTMDNIDRFLGHVFTMPQRICAYNTYQFRDYSKYVVEVFSEEEKRAYRAKHWPDDVGQAYSLAREIALKERI